VARRNNPDDPKFFLLRAWRRRPSAVPDFRRPND